MNSSQIKTFVLLIIFAGLAAVMGLAFIDNVDIIAKYWSDFRAVGGDSTKMAKEYTGIIPALDWMAVDYSAVSTFIPFFGFLFAAIGCFRILFTKKIRQNECFPFFPYSDLLNISLGLIGTLWGIIVIGYYDMSTIEIDILIECLHTALFSTLIAVVWVYLIDHPIIRPLMRSCIKTAQLETDDDEQDVLEIIESLRRGAAGIRKAWEEERSNLSALVDRMKSAKETLGDFDRAAQRAGVAIDKTLATSVQSVTSRLSDIAEQLDATRRSAEEQAAARNEKLNKAYEKHLGQLNEAYEKRICHLNETFDKRIEIISEQNEKISLICEKLEDQSHRLLKENSRLKDELENAEERGRELRKRAEKAEENLNTIKKVISGE